MAINTFVFVGSCAGSGACNTCTVHVVHLVIFDAVKPHQALNLFITYFIM